MSPSNDSSLSAELRFDAPVRLHFTVTLHTQPSNSCCVPFRVIAARKRPAILDTNVSKYFDSFLLSGPALCHGSHDITGSTSAFSNSRSLIPQNSSRPKKGTKNNHLFDAKTTIRLLRLWILWRKYFVTLAYYSLATIIHAWNNVITSFSFSQLGVTCNKKHMVKKKFTTKSRFDYFQNDTRHFASYTTESIEATIHTERYVLRKNVPARNVYRFCLPFAANENQLRHNITDTENYLTSRNLRIRVIKRQLRLRNNFHCDYRDRLSRNLSSTGRSRTPLLTSRRCAERCRRPFVSSLWRIKNYTMDEVRKYNSR